MGAFCEVGSIPATLELILAIIGGIVVVAVVVAGAWSALEYTVSGRIRELSERNHDLAARLKDQP